MAQSPAAIFTRSRRAGASLIAAATSLVMVCLMAVMPLQATAQESYPEKVITLVVPFPAGGTTDILARVVGQYLSDEFGQQVIIDNRGGAGGNIAAEIVVRAAPDGYTLMISSPGVLIVNPVIYQNLPFNPTDDLVPIATLVDVSSALVVPADKPWRSVADLIEAARRQPGRLNWGYSGVGSTNHIAGGMLSNLSRIETVAVPYRGGGPLMTDLISGKIDFAFSTAPTALPQIEGGKLRALAVPTARRSAITGALPAVAETLPGFEVANWYALLGPKALPPAITARLNAAMQETLRDPEMVAHLARHGTEPRPGPPEELARFIRQETEKWAPIVRATGANPN